MLNIIQFNFKKCKCNLHKKLKEHVSETVNMGVEFLYFGLFFGRKKIRIPIYGLNEVAS